MHKNNILLQFSLTFFACLSAAFAQVATTTTPPDFELVVIESLPEGISLDMKLSDILDAKEKSELQLSKEKIYKILVGNINPLLNEQTFSKEYNLLHLARQIPVRNILEDLIAEGSDFKQKNPADFMALILPKAPSRYNEKSLFPFAQLYATNKAAVIDKGLVGFQPNRNYEDLINERILEGIQLAYQHTYIENQSNEAFFVGALFHIHLAGPQSQIRVQIIGGLPTDQSEPFDQLEKEAHFTEVRHPKTPDLQLNPEYFPGAILELSYQYDQNEKAKLNISFGAIGMINGKDWMLNDSLPPFEEYKLGTEGFGIASVFRSYNVPNLFGDILLSSGSGWADYYLIDPFNIQMNIHEVELDIQTLEIKTIRVTAQPIAKPERPLYNSIWSRIGTPSFELPDVNKKFLEAGNKELEPYRETLQTLTANGPMVLLENPSTQMQFVNILKGLLEKNSEGQQ